MQFPETVQEYRDSVPHNEKYLFDQGAKEVQDEFLQRKLKNVELVNLRHNLRKAYKEASADSNKFDLKEMTRKGFSEHYYFFTANFSLEVDYKYNVDTFRADKEVMKDIKKRMEQNMDNLVDNLNRLDYRDFLTVNKYIIESQREEEYHIHARGKVLAAAVKR